MWQTIFQCFSFLSTVFYWLVVGFGCCVCRGAVGVRGRWLIIVVLCGRYFGVAVQVRGLITHLVIFSKTFNPQPQSPVSAHTQQQG